LPGQLAPGIAEPISEDLVLGADLKAAQYEPAGISHRPARYLDRMTDLRGRRLNQNGIVNRATDSNASLNRQAATKPQDIGAGSLDRKVTNAALVVLAQLAVVLPPDRPSRTGRKPANELYVINDPFRPLPEFWIDFAMVL